MNILDKVRPNILKLQPYSSARDEFEGNAEIFLDANENPFDNGFNRYPDPYQSQLKQEISKLKGVEPNHIFLGNGSDEAIDLIIRIFCEPGQDNIIISDPSYGMYQVSAAINNVAIQKVPLSEEFTFSAQGMLEAADNHSRVAFICSPNNPSGNALDPEEVITMIRKFDGIVVVDEAYIDFSSTPSFINQLEKYNNLVILQTFSKAWGLAGLRLGMAFSSPEIIQLMNKVKPPYNINILTQTEALKALQKPGKVAEEIQDILKQRDWLINELSSFSQVRKIYPSDSNFLLVRITNAKSLFEYLTAQGIIVRDRSKVTHGNDCLRMTVGTENENKRLITAIKEFLA